MSAVYTYIKNGSSLVLDIEKCTGCGNCVEVCPHRVFEMAMSKAFIVSRATCMECGACALNCPAAALSVNKGVGCVAAVLQGMITGKEASCGCGDDGSAGCC